jgi:hypothetical protein
MMDGYDIFFHQELPEDMRTEILGHCAPAQLAVFALLSKEWAERVRARLATHLFEGFTFHVYPWANGAKTYLDWTGPLTYGSAFFRGLRVFLHEAAGRKVDMSETDDAATATHVPVETHLVNCGDEVAFWEDDTILRVSHPDEILYGTESLAYIRCKEDLRALSAVEDGFIEAAERHFNTWPRGGIFYEPLAYVDPLDDDDMGIVIFINNLKAFLSEIRRVKAIGERHDVSFEWI